jgi:Protein of unknown function (DUF2723)
VSRSILGALAIVFALAHIPYLASSLEDIDSVNFALGVRDFDVADHRPHPPGYPLYIALAKVGVSLASVFGGSNTASAVEARTLSALSLGGALAAILLCYRVLAAVSAARQGSDVRGTAPAEAGALRSAPWREPNVAALAGTALVAACPLFWYLAIRPMSDVPGLAVALAAQASLALAWWRQRPLAGSDGRLNREQMAASGRAIVLGALLSGLAIGLRSQNALLTIPLLLGVLVDRIGRGVVGAMLGGAVAFTIGLAVWAVPLVAVSGGWNAYTAALGSQAGEDFAGGEMLYVNPSDPRLAAFALMRTLLYPWDSLALGSVVVVLAVIGLGALMVRDRRSVVAITLVSLPYAVFHLLFHDTSYVRYALPLVPPVVLLAVRGAEVIAGRRALAVVGVLAVWSVVIAAPIVAAYASEPSPVARVVATARDAAKLSPPGALALHQTFSRPLQAEDFSVPTQLASPPRREWLELTKYWREHTAPVWFLADPQRSDLVLIDPQSRRDRVDYAWRFQSMSNMGGMRPSAVQWFRMPPPGWFAGEGWALSPETAGIARVMGRGPSLGPISAWVRRRPDPVSVLVGGRHLGAPSDPPAQFVMSVDGTEVARWDAAPGFFLHDFKLPADSLRGEGLAELTIRSSSEAGSPVPTAIEQFDVQSTGTLMWGYDKGWHEAEFNTALGVWRWTSDRATLRIIGWTGPIEIAFRIESPRKYFDEDPIVRLTAGGEVLGETRFADRETWSTSVPVAALSRADGRITIEVNRTFVPAERGAPDQRRLGLRVFGVSVSAQH